MEEPTDPDAPSSPAQPAEEIPDWVKGHLLDDASSEEGAGAGQPAAETLAEKHKAQRQNFHRLTEEAKAPRPRCCPPTGPADARHVPAGPDVRSVAIAERTTAGLYGAGAPRLEMSGCGVRHAA